MTLALIFWILMLLMLILGFVLNEGRARYWPGLMIWLLFVILGWAVFGSPISG